MVLRIFDIHMQKNETAKSVLLSRYKNQLKWIRDLKIRPDTMKPREESIKEMFQDARIRKNC